MARGAAQARRKRTKAEAARRRRRAQSAAPTHVAEKTMFFPKLRRQAKWVFVFLALVFALGFVVFGVGSGGGIGLGDLFGTGGSGQTASESKAREAIKKNPDNAQAYQDLSNALQTKGDLRGATSALETYTQLRPQNTDALAALAGLYTALGFRLQTEITAAQESAQSSSFATALDPGLQAGNQSAVGTNAIFQSLADRANSKLTVLYQRQQDDFNKAEKVSKKIVALNPKDANSQLNLGQAAQTAGDTKGAIAAYKKFIKLAPDDPNVAAVKQQIKALRQAAKSPNVSAG
jgi:tetratricopeptide (TPR) repeat protein